MGLEPGLYGGAAFHRLPDRIGVGGQALAQCARQTGEGVLEAVVSHGADVGIARCRFEGCRRDQPATNDQAVFCAFRPSLPIVCSRITNFWILPVMVMGNSATNSM